MLQIIMLWVFCYLLLIIYKIICFSCSDFFSFFYFFFSLINLARGLPVVLVCFGFVDLLVLYFTDFCHLYFLYFGRLHSIFSVFFSYILFFLAFLFFLKIQAFKAQSNTFSSPKSFEMYYFNYCSVQVLLFNFR